MEAYLQHLKSLREQLNDHEDKLALLHAEESEVQTYIRHLVKDLDSVRDASKGIEVEVETFQKEISQLSKQMISCQELLGNLDSDSHTLSQASELLIEDFKRQSNRLIEKKLYYEKVQAETRSQLDEYEAYYKSRTCKADVDELHNGVKRKAENSSAALQENHQEATCDVETAVAKNELNGSKINCAERRIHQLREEIHKGEEELKTAIADNVEVDRENQTLEEKIDALQEEKLAEEAFIQSLYERLEQLQGHSQDVHCSSCKHTYFIEWKDKEFIVRDRSGETN